MFFDPCLKTRIMITAESLVQTLVQCAKHCNECAAACLNEKNVNHLANCIKLNLECADYCQACARMIQQNSVHSLAAIQLCTSVCGTCKEECEKNMIILIVRSVQLCALNARSCVMNG